MSNLLESVKAITSIDNWKELIDLFINNKLNRDDPNFELIFHFITDIRNQYKKCHEIPSELKDVLEDEVSNDLNSFLADSLKWYFDMELLRIAEKKSNDFVKDIVNIIFYDYVLNVGIDPVEKIINCFKDDDITRKTVINVISAVNYYVYNSISKTISKDNISLTLQNNSDLSKETSDCLASLVNDNRIELKLNLIINNMNEQEE